MPGRLQPICLLAVVVTLSGAVGCARADLGAIRADVAAGRGALIAGVPFIPQDAYQCGPASLAMVLRYYGASVDEAEITRALYLPSVRGTLNFDLEFYARRRGFRVESFEGTLARVKQAIREGRPVIVFQDLGVGAWSIPHFAVLIGYDDRARTVVLHSGTTAYLVVAYADFERTWSARRRWTLLITPPPPAG